MIRYLALSVVGCVLLSSGVSSAQAEETQRAAGGAAGVNQRDLRMLDESLARKVEEQIRFIDMLERHLRGGQIASGDKDAAEVLARKKPEPAPAPTPVASVKPTVPVKPAPWWKPYRVDMIVHAADESVAMVNGRTVRTGDMLSPSVQVAAIRDDKVIIYRGDQRHDLVFKVR